jgi:hypothetical protein
MHGSPQNEAQLEVEVNGGTVRVEHVQERSFPARRNGSHERTYKLGREPLSSAGRVDAHGADFRKAVEPHALSCHRDQYSLASSADVLPEFYGAWTERPWMRGLHKCLHVWNVPSVQRNDRHRAVVHGHFDQDHLIYGTPLEDRKEWGRADFVKSKKSDPIIRRQKGEQ